MDWKTIKEHGPPPFDTLVVAKGTQKNDHGSWPVYAIAYNECFCPKMCMTQRVEMPKGHDDSMYTAVPFEIEEWCELE